MRIGWVILRAVSAAAALTLAQFLCVRVMLHSNPTDDSWVTTEALVAAGALMLITVVGVLATFALLRVRHLLIWSAGAVFLEIWFAREEFAYVPSHVGGDSRVFFWAIPLFLSYTVAGLLDRRTEPDGEVSATQPLDHLKERG